MSQPTSEALAFYREPGLFTQPGTYETLFKRFPESIA